MYGYFNANKIKYLYVNAYLCIVLAYHILIHFLIRQFYIVNH